MSLFPAYSKAISSNEKADIISDKQEHFETKHDQSWLSNPSFVNEPTTSTKAIVNFDEKVSKSSSEENDDNREEKSERKKKKRKKKGNKEHRKKQKKEEKHHQIIEFTGSEEYYVDKKPERGYMNVETLFKPACPRYRVYLNTLGSYSKRSSKLTKRYYIKNKKDRIEIGDYDNVEHLSEAEFIIKNKNFNKKLGENPGDIDMWIEFVKHQDLTHMKSTKIQIVERKMNILDKALKENPCNEELYRLYIDVIDQVYPSFEVSKILNRLLTKDPTNYTLWNAQIMTSQGSMARCTVPNVIKLYEECMKSMYNKNRYDEVMLKLFTNCCLFMRQAGLYEQFFALIKLALTLNVSDDKFSNIQPYESDQDALIEYEEVILKSGLPMNEIWLRIEKLRENFYFLPCPENRTCSDPQRIVFNEDVVHFVYPLANKEYCFNLTIIILKLLKVPMPGCSLKHCFFTKQENCYEFDSIEEILPIFLHNTFLSCPNYDTILFDLIKDFSIGPSYVITHIGYEIYLRVISEILLICSDCFETRNLRNIFVLMWLKLERILLIMEKMAGKITEEKAKKFRTKIKNTLKQEKNRNILMFYTEYALMEYDLGNIGQMENIFHTAIELSKPSENKCTKSEFYSIYIAYVETLITINMEKALSVLTCLALNRDISECKEMDIGETRKLLALKKLSERLNEIIFIEKNVNIMELEQCFLPDYLISLMKAKIYYLLLVKKKKDAIDEIEILIKTFPEHNNRHTFVRENLYEIYVNVLQISTKHDFALNIVLHDVLKRGLDEFPSNLFLLKATTILEGLTWPKLRTLLTKSNSSIAVVFLVAAAKYRTLKSIDCSTMEDFDGISTNTDTTSITYKIRICNLLKSVTSKKSPLRKNSLLWRLYLRVLLDLKENFDKSRNILLAALDECPWNKALYLDGTVYVPQELPHIQDLIIEKQLRIYALPEELEILRSDDAVK